MNSEHMGPKERAEVEESRTLSNAELIQGGAHFEPNENGGDPRLEVTDEQIQKIRAEAPEEEKGLIEKLRAKEHENINAFEKEIDTFIETFPIDNPSENDIRKLLHYVRMTGTSYTDGSRRQDENDIGAFAAKMNFPVKAVEMNYGRGGSVTRYRLGEEAKELTKEILQRTDEKLTPFAIKIAEKLLSRPRDVLAQKYPEIIGFVRKIYPNFTVRSMDDVKELLNYQRRGGVRSSLDRQSEQADDAAREEKVNEYLDILYTYSETQHANVTTISGAIKFLDRIS